MKPPGSAAHHRTGEVVCLRQMGVRAGGEFSQEPALHSGPAAVQPCDGRAGVLGEGQLCATLGAAEGERDGGGNWGERALMDRPCEHVSM